MVFFQWGQKIVQKHESESSKYRVKTLQVSQDYFTVDLKEDYFYRFLFILQILLNIFMKIR